MVLLILGLAAVFTWLFVKSRTLAVAVDSNTLCASDAPPTEVAVIVLDVSDRFSDQQYLQIRNQLSRVRNTVLRHGLVEIFSVAQTWRQVSEPVLHLCNPGTGADLNRLYQNPELARRRWDTFAGKLDTEMREQAFGEGQAESPIFETIQAASIRTFSNPEYDGRPKRLILVSDLLQHVPGRLSMYASVPSFQSFSTTPYYRQVRAPLDGVSVSIYYLARATATTQGARHIAFWEEFLRAQSATVESVEQVFGDR